MKVKHKASTSCPDGRTERRAANVRCAVVLAPRPWLLGPGAVFDWQAVDVRSKAVVSIVSSRVARRQWILGWCAFGRWLAVAFDGLFFTLPLPYASLPLARYIYISISIFFIQNICPDVFHFLTYFHSTLLYIGNVEEAKNRTSEKSNIIYSNIKQQATYKISHS